MDYEKSILFLCKAKQKEQEDKLYFRWCTGGYQHEMSFDEFKENAKKASLKTKDVSVENILKKVKVILNSNKEERNGTI